MKKLFGENGLFAKIGRRNLILFGAVLLIGGAVYANYLWFYGDAGKVDYGSNNMSDVYKSTEGTADESGTEDYFSATALNRQQARDEALEVLNLVANNAEAEETAKMEALAEISQIAADMSNESNIETLVTAKGFAQCVAVINGDAISVIVKSDEELLAGQVAQISEIVYQQAGILPTNLTIIRK